MFPQILQGENSKNMVVSKNNGTPKWMVKIVENPIKLDDLGTIFGNPHMDENHTTKDFCTNFWLPLPPHCP